jgi:hypothetical protein
MRPPLHRMRIPTATAEFDKTFTNSADANHLNSPLGGAYGHGRQRRVHQGWDLYAPIGTPASPSQTAALNSRRIEALLGYGLQVCVRIAAPNVVSRYQTGLYVFYGHLLPSAVRHGHAVKASSVIRCCGVSGNATDVTLAPRRICVLTFGRFLIRQHNRDLTAESILARFLATNTTPAR